ncbi:periplasmic iron-binding protein [Stappia sp. 22II-S9-Z10]|nr:periplasmic iron-binding protein [Stappia sp. 22II-S9-Z10]
MRSRLARLLAAPGLMLALCLVLAGCTEEEPQLLRIWSATDVGALRGTLDAFARANPDIHVEYTEFNTSELALAVRDAARAPERAIRPDVVISSAADLQVDLVNDGLARRLDIGAAGPDWANWRGELFGFTAEPVAMIYNVDAFADRSLPRSRSELASMIRDAPEIYDRRVGTYDIERSGVGYMFATQDAARGYQSTRLVETLGRAGARTFCCTNLMIEEVASGRMMLAYNVIGSYALAAAEGDPRFAVHFLSDYTLVFARSAFVPVWAAAPDAAERFVAYLVSDEGQAAIEAGGQLLPLAAAAGDAEAKASRMPVRLGPGLLTFLDQLKKARFLHEWRLSFMVQAP